MTTNTQTAAADAATDAALFATKNSAATSKRNNTYYEPALLAAANFQAIAKATAARLTQKKGAAHAIDLRYRGASDGAAALITRDGEKIKVAFAKCEALGRTGKSEEIIAVADLEAKIVEIMTQVANAEGISRAKGSKSKAYAVTRN